ncbi:ChbG/HpnK family deacetylase [Kineococcus esterisolvens]|uniref:ChbG/HpnK family deacetylase n=1 Tax=unclassified Kineococcus TaxID=2621656 RepID=UPI003D7D18C9
MDHPDSSSTSSSVQLLGLPANARVLILDCDDLGMHPSINTAILAAVRQGVASSASLMVPCPAAGEALRLLRAAPEVPFGIHLTLTRDGPAHRWAPISAPQQVPSLVDEEGLFRTSAAVPELLSAPASRTSSGSCARSSTWSPAPD